MQETSQDILSPRTDHSWTMVQTWHNLLFAHWPLPPSALRPFVPPQLELETFEGQAWVGVVPFHMSDIRWRGRWPLPLAHRFAELNVRTYVRYGDRSGVFFFSLDAASWVAVVGARLLYHLPYFYAHMRVTVVDRVMHYTSQRRHPGSRPATFEATYRPTGEATPAPPGSLEQWLVERYALFTVDRRGRVYRGDIAHEPWPLQPAEAEIRANTMLPPGIPLPARPPLLHYAERLEVRIWPLVVATPPMGGTAGSS